MLPSRIFFDSLLDDYEDSRFKKSMKCDIFEKDGNYNVVMDIPGFKKEDINIECDNGVIKISCEKKEEENQVTEIPTTGTTMGEYAAMCALVFSVCYIGYYVLYRKKATN